MQEPGEALELLIDEGQTLDAEDEDLRKDWLARISSLLRVVSAADELRAEFDGLDWEYHPIALFVGEDTSGWPETSRNIRKDSMKSVLRILNAASTEYRYLNPASAIEVSDNAKPTRGSQRVFIVYGHDHALRAEVAGYLERVLGTRPTVFDEESSAGSEMVFEKLERLGTDAGFAVVLMTPDDTGGAKAGGDSRARARQNVLIELGWFAGVLGRDRVRIIRDGDTEIPSDLEGILYTAASGNWKLELAQDLKSAGLEVDLNQALA